MDVALMNRLFFIATVVLYTYITIGLYIHIGIMFFVYCVVCLLLYCMLQAWGDYFLYIYILFLFLTSTSIFLQMSELRRQIYSTQLQAKNSL